MSIAPAIGELGFRRPLLVAATAGGGVLAADQASKAWFRSNVGEMESGPDVGPLETVRVEHEIGSNTGLMSDSRTNYAIRLGIAAVTAPTAVAVAGYAPKSSAPLALAFAAGVGLIAGGTAGNAAEMLIRGAATDFLVVEAADDRTYAANIADVGTMAGQLGMGALLLGGGGYAAVRGVRALIRA